MGKWRATLPPRSAPVWSDPPPLHFLSWGRFFIRSSGWLFLIHAVVAPGINQSFCTPFTDVSALAPATALFLTSFLLLQVFLFQSQVAWACENLHMCSWLSKFIFANAQEASWDPRRLQWGGFMDCSEALFNYWDSAYTTWNLPFYPLCSAQFSAIKCTHQMCNHHHHPSLQLFPSSQTETLPH